MAFRPRVLTILGKRYVVTYCRKPSDVDIHGCESLWGQVDHWTKTIRVYDRGEEDVEVLHRILHEVIHAVAQELKIKQLDGKENDNAVALLALGLAGIEADGQPLFGTQRTRR